MGAEYFAALPIGKGENMNFRTSGKDYQQKEISQLLSH